MGPAERDLLTGPRRPIVLLRESARGASLPRPSPRGNPDLGVMLPYTPLHHLLFEGAEFPALVMTSGNLSEEPIVSREEDLPRLAGLADRFLTHNRPIRTAVDDSVVRVFAAGPLVLRRSRGYAPAPIDLGRPVPDLVAAGGELKNTFCLTTGHYAILSQHIGDLENYETLVFFRETLGAHAALLPRASAKPWRTTCIPAISAPARPREMGLPAHRRAAPSRAHRQLHGGEPPGGPSHRRGVRRHRLRHRWRHLGRRSAGLRLRRASSAATTCATCRWPAAMQARANPGAWPLAYLRDAGLRLATRPRSSRRQRWRWWNR